MELETLLRIGIDILRLVPLVLVFYIPALLAAAIFREKGENYRVKAALTFAGSFVAILGALLLVRSVSVEQALQTIALSGLQMAVALLLAVATVYKLAD